MKMKLKPTDVSPIYLEQKINRINLQAYGLSNRPYYLGSFFVSPILLEALLLEDEHSDLPFQDKFIR